MACFINFFTTNKSDNFTYGIIYGNRICDNYALWFNAIFAKLLGHFLYNKQNMDVVHSLMCKTNFTCLVRAHVYCNHIITFAMTC